uniref:EF-hand domain-containing protein n=1 Tax=Knipowitschia caucasica TaxID=637954 RepID=A0AAV2JWU2_KNICA
MWVREWFSKADKNRDGLMTFKEAKTLLKMMNVEMNDDHALRLFTLSDKLGRGSLDMEEFVFFYKLLTQRDEVWKVFQDFSSDGERLLLAELSYFLCNEQKEAQEEDQQERAEEMIRLPALPFSVSIERHLYQPHLYQPHLYQPHLYQPHLYQPHLYQPHLYQPHLYQPHLYQPHLYQPHLYQPHLYQPHLYQPHTYQIQKAF